MDRGSNFGLGLDLQKSAYHTGPIPHDQHAYAVLRTPGGYPLTVIDYTQMNIPVFLQ